MTADAKIPIPTNAPAMFSAPSIPRIRAICLIAVESPLAPGAPRRQGRHDVKPLEGADEQGERDHPSARIPDVGREILQQDDRSDRKRRRGSEVKKRPVDKNLRKRIAGRDADDRDEPRQVRRSGNILPRPSPIRNHPDVRQTARR